jgi:hypothetical protein
LAIEILWLLAFSCQRSAVSCQQSAGIARSMWLTTH